MKITRRQTTIELNEEEKKIIGDATKILLKVMYEIDNNQGLLGYGKQYWDEITHGLEEVSEKGEFVIE